MQNLTLTALRKNLFQVADQVLATGEPVIIERHGRRLALVAESAQEADSGTRKPKLDNLPRRKLFKGDPDDLAEFKVWKISEWQEPNKLR
jgi:antitoxin (DNA-binding transcriptional repressor) of toxin-antitoxin stability system